MGKPKTIDARMAGSGGLARNAATAALVLWQSRMFSTADIADLLGVPEAEVSRVVTVARSLTLEAAR